MMKLSNLDPRLRGDDTWRLLEQQIIHCQKCPRLITWCHHIATEKTRRFQSERYWGKPVPGFGDPAARLLIVGLAPAAHGANRTGRMFTGDQSGLWLYRALHRAGFANQATSTDRNDGLTLRDSYISAAARCAPPDNKPTPEELTNCQPYLLEELALLKDVRVVLGLGKIGFDRAFEALVRAGKIESAKRPKFSHGAVFRHPSPSGEGLGVRGIALIASYHPSQQNTFTKKLTEKMFDDVFQAIGAELDVHANPAQKNPPGSISPARPVLN